MLNPKNVQFLFALVILCVLSACGGGDTGGNGGGTTTYSVGGNVSGLTGTVVLQNNGGDDLTISANGAFTFTTQVTDGSTYAVTVLTQPDGQTCSVTNASGTIAGANVNNVSAGCVDNPPGTYSVGGNVSGLTGTVVLQNNSGDDLTISANGAFTFTTPVTDGSAYDVTVLTQPNGQTCSATNVSGTIAGANVTNVAVTCMSFFEDTTAISAGDTHTVALKTDGTVWAWGYNLYGQLGDGTSSSSTTPVQVVGLTDVAAIATGYRYTVALKTDGTVWTWGSYVYMPVQVTNLTDISAIAAGISHTVALKTDGTVWTWGDNKFGQLGDGTMTDSPMPVQVCAAGETSPCSSFLTDVAAITAGNVHTVAVKTDGTVWAWGNNFHSQLGDGTKSNRTTPVQASGIVDVSAVAAGNYHTIALKTDGSVWSWGDNEYGQLGDRTTIESTTPVAVYDLADISAVAAGSFHTVALKTDGSVWSWGYNEYGQLGDGTLNTRTMPMQIIDLTDVSAIAGGSSHTVALKIDGTVWAWGDNSPGQLGDGTTTNSSAPVQVLTGP